MRAGNRQGCGQSDEYAAETAEGYGADWQSFFHHVPRGKWPRNHMLPRYRDEHRVEAPDGEQMIARCQWPRDGGEGCAIEPGEPLRASAVSKNEAISGEPLQRLIFFRGFLLSTLCGPVVGIFGHLVAVSVFC